MAQVYDIVNRLTNDKPVIKLGESKEFKVNNSKNSVILIKSLSEDKTLDDFEMMDKVIEAGIGKEGLDYVNSLDLTFKSYETIMNAIMAAITEQSLEEIEKMAEEETKKIKKK
ncbi:hypothetical protein HAHI6034_05775 [Hathewaya histolytica]|uniref:Phage XkdN-like protein n=1 Tax=Hathewaya histolytica TaxID=1498 RepID=A0A4U9REU2_HATHI|nr:hypothetical protein [Hathewaya histolytica]VTQ89716.1 Uncharacterised protein [Hathewaya histolytica]